MHECLSLLDAKNIHAFNVDHCLSKVGEGCFLLYAPLGGIMTLVSGEWVQEAEQAVRADRFEEFCQTVPFLGAMLSLEAQHIPALLTNPHTFTKISILPTAVCNFSCSYCYSAQGRSGAVLSKQDIKTALDFFIDAKRIAQQNLTVFISGGGEPLLSWDCVRFILEYSSKRAQRKGFTCTFILITNGYLLSPEIRACLKQYAVNVCVSFEILQDLQNAHRSHYQHVKKKILECMNEKLNISLNSTITPHSVSRLEEMALEAIASFPGITSLTIEPAIDASLFPSVQSLRDFHDIFLPQFYRARTHCQAHGINVDFTLSRAMDTVKARHCPGKLCLIPEGSFSVCHCVSSSQEARYSSCIYGSIKNGVAVFDVPKFQYILDNSSFSRPDCATCYARWHCGGGCMTRNETYPPDLLDEMCRFIREVVQREIEERFLQHCHTDQNAPQEMPTSEAV